jgi:hypothetical protein
MKKDKVTTDYSYYRGLTQAKLDAFKRQGRNGAPKAKKAPTK